MPQGQPVKGRENRKQKDDDHKKESQA